MTGNEARPAEAERAGTTAGPGAGAPSPSTGPRGGRQVGPWAGIVVALAGIAVFAVAALAVVTGASGGIDVAVHDGVVAGRVAGMDGFWIAVSAVFDVAIESVLVAVVAVAFWLSGRPRSAVLLAASMAVIVVMTTALKHLVDRPRPDPSLWLGPPETSPSFPSGHVACAAVFVLVAGYLWWRAGPSRARWAAWLTGSVAVVLLVAFSRLYLGVHWLSDTAASVGLAVAVLGIVLLADGRWGDGRRRTGE